MKFFYLLMPLFFLSGCFGYQTLSSREKIPVVMPFIEGDRSGFVTQAVAEAMMRSTTLRLVNGGSPWRLIIKIVEDRMDDISYQYDVDPNDDKVTNRLIPNESRRSLRALVTVVDLMTNRRLLDRFSVEVSSEFDYVNSDSLVDLSFTQNGQLQNVLDFSLGQLDSVEGAKSNSILPTSRAFAMRIIHGIDGAIVEMQQ